MAERGKGKAAAEEASGGNINQIRDILVGPFQRQQEARLEALERAVERLGKDSAAATKRLEEKLQKRIAATGEKLQKKVSDLSKALKDGSKSQKEEAEAVAAGLSGQIDKLQDEITGELRGLEKLTDAHVSALRNDLYAAVAQLRDEKTGREDLGDYLMELGLRLKGEGSLESIESSLKGMKGGDANA